MDPKRTGSKKSRPSKLAPGMEATANQLEASKVVLNGLKRAETEEDILFLKPVAEKATSILDIIQAIEEGEVDDDFASLGLDSCGLTFIIINECDQCLNNDEPIPDKLKWGAGELAENLEEIKTFVHKRTARNFFKRHLKQSSDGQKVAQYREKLKGWMGKLEIETNLSIHEKLDAVIGEKIQKHDMEVQAARKAKDPKKLGDLQAQTKAIVPGSEVDFTRSQPVPIESSPRSSRFDKEKPLPTITVSSQPQDDGDLQDQSASGKSQQTEVDHAASREREAKGKLEDEAKRMKRLEDERAARKAEKERFRRSEQEFSRIPQTPLSERPSFDKPPSSLGSRPATPTSIHSRPLTPTVTKTKPPGPREPFKPTTTVPHDEEKDRELAAQIQAEFEREIAEEKERKAADDERKALEIAASLQRQWEAEDEKFVPDKTGKKVGSRSMSFDSSEGNSAYSSESGSSTTGSHPSPDPTAARPGSSSYPNIPRSQSPNDMNYPSAAQIPRPKILSTVLPGAVPNNITNTNSGNLVNTKITNSFNHQPRTYNYNR